MNIPLPFILTNKCLSCCISLPYLMLSDVAKVSCSSTVDLC